MTFSAKTFSQLSLPLNFSYVATNDSDQTCTFYPMLPSEPSLTLALCQQGRIGTTAARTKRFTPTESDLVSPPNHVAKNLYLTLPPPLSPPFSCLFPPEHRLQDCWTDRNETYSNRRHKRKLPHRAPPKLGLAVYTHRHLCSVRLCVRIYSIYVALSC